MSKYSSRAVQLTQIALMGLIAMVMRCVLMKFIASFGYHFPAAMDAIFVKWETHLIPALKTALMVRICLPPTYATIAILILATHSMQKY
eukprot:13374083-Ditylum_brightwellii.AAC.1